MKTSFKKMLLALLCLLMAMTFLSACAGDLTDIVLETDVSSEGSDDEPSDTPSDTVITQDTVFDESNVVLSFGSISDVHLTGTENDQAEQYFRSAISQLKEKASVLDKDGLDAIAMAGDIADHGKKTEIEQLKNIVDGYGINNIMLTTGNHDNDHDPNTEKVFLTDFYDVMGDRYFGCATDLSMLDKGAYHCVVGGYHFIFIEPKKYADYAPYDADVLEWLDATLKAITSESPDSYVFIYTHPMIYKTVYGSNDEINKKNLATKYLTQTLSKYPQVVTFSGHLHFPLNDERSIMQTSFTSLGCGAVRNVFVENLFENVDGTKPPKRLDVSTGILVQIDGNGNLRLTRMYFSQNTTIKEPWELPHPTADGAHLNKYRADRKNVNQAPMLDGEIKIKKSLSSGTGVLSNVAISFTAGKDDDLIHHYEMTVKDKSTNASKTYKYITDFYIAATPADMAKTVIISIPSEFIKVGEYTVSITAVDSWGARSNTQSAELSISENGAELSAELPTVYTDFEFNGGVVSDTNGKFNTVLKGATVSDTSLTFNGKNKTVGALNVKASRQYAEVTFKDYNATSISEFYNSEKGFSIEALYVNRAPNGTQGIVCGTDSPGGWGLADDGGKPYLYTYTEDGGIKVATTASSGELTHIVATVQYDSDTDTTYTYIYVNGVLAGSGLRIGRVKAHPEEALATTFCFGADIKKDGTNCTAQYFMTDFSLADVKIYSDALNYKQVGTAYNNSVSLFNS